MEDRRSFETLDSGGPSKDHGPGDGSATRAGAARDGSVATGATGDCEPVLVARRRPGTWSDLGWLVLAQVAVMLPLLAVAAGLGGSHMVQVGTAAACVWPWVLISYTPMLLTTTSTSILVQFYLAITIRMFGTLATVVVVRQIAAPLAPDSWFIYISAYYLAGLTAESWLMIAGLHRD